MIVDGATELVGSDWSRAESAIAAATKLEKVPIRLSPVRGAVRVEVDAIPSFAAGEKRMSTSCWLRIAVRPTCCAVKTRDDICITLPSLRISSTWET